MILAEARQRTGLQPTGRARGRIRRTAGDSVRKAMNSTGQRWIVGPEEAVLVTGAGGFIGARVVKTLLDYGFRRVRCFVRPSSRLEGLYQVQETHRGSDLQIIEGNLLSRADCARALGNAAVIYHLAAGVDKSYAGCFMNSVLTTRNLLDAVVARGGLKRFVNISSFAVYSNLDLPRGSVFDETVPLESKPSERNDPYGYAKLKQDALVMRYQQQFGLPSVTLRPGAVFGPGKPSLSGRIGIDTFGIFLHVGGSNHIPLTFVDNCAEAIVQAGLVVGIEGETFNVVDDDLPTSRSFLRLYKQQVGSFWSLPVPYPVAYGLSALWERYSRWSQGQLPPRFNRRRASAEWKRHQFSNAKLKQRVGWAPRVPFDPAFQMFVNSLARKA
jgi:nucleoside-diphosphate-sugar epimerase